MAVQTTNLIMISLGCEGLMSKQDVEDGNQMRWKLDSTLGFPRYGFDLYRRPHVQGILTLISRTLITRNAGEVTFNLGQICRNLSLKMMPTGTRPVTGKAIGLFSGKTMVEVPFSGIGGAVIIINMVADAISEIALPIGVSVISVDGIPVTQQDADDPTWGKLLNDPKCQPNKTQRICLPITVTDPTNPYPCRHAHTPDEWAEAASRLKRRTATSGGAIILPPEIENRYGGQNFQDLLSMLQSASITGLRVEKQNKFI